MNSLWLPLTQLVADAFPGRLASRIDLEMSLQMLPSNECTYQASVPQQPSAVISGQFFMRRCHGRSLAERPLEFTWHWFHYCHFTFNRIINTLCWWNQCSEQCISGRYFAWCDTSESGKLWNSECKMYLKIISDEGVKAYARVWHLMKVYQ